MRDVDAIVIGAGCGGLTTGSLLAGQGRRVLVLEQSGAVGGCASSFRRDGHTFDVGASIFEVLDSLERVFAALGTTIEEELDLIRCDPTLAVVLQDGTRLTFPASEEGVADVLGRISAEDKTEPTSRQTWSKSCASCSRETHRSCASPMGPRRSQSPCPEAWQESDGDAHCRRRRSSPRPGCHDSIRR